MTLSDFKYYVGETLNYCQSIEHDVKWIYAMMLSGNNRENYNDIADWTLGKVVNELEELDYSDNDNLLSHSQYDLLREIKDERNYLVHQAFRDFSYEQGYRYDMAFQKACSRLMNFHNRLEKLWQRIEDIRVDFANS